jgi:hypothetical protein
MGKSKYQGDSPLLVSAAALLTKQRISYVDDGKYTVVKFSPKGNYLHKVLKFPKDGHTDALRFTEALQEKIPLVDGCYPIKVLPPPLEGKVGSATPAMNSKFYKGWEHRDAALTCFRWDGAFTTLPYLYRQDGVYQEVDLSGEHYYNILMTRPQKEEFEKVNPEFFFEECPGTCATKRGYPHFHAIHGFYVGSDVGDVGCAPPWRLCDAWKWLKLSSLQEVRRGFLLKIRALQVESLQTTSHKHGWMTFAHMKVLRYWHPSARRLRKGGTLLSGDTFARCTSALRQLPGRWQKHPRPLRGGIELQRTAGQGCTPIVSCPSCGKASPSLRCFS